MLLFKEPNIRYFILFSLLTITGMLFFLWQSTKKRNSILQNEIHELNGLLEQKIKDRTRQLETERDMISEYAVQKFELAHELEMRYIETARQKDELTKKSENLREVYEEIKKLDTFRKKMIRMLVHDLKNPINIIINTAEISGIKGKHAITINQVAYEMLILINNILDVSKLEESRIKINPRNFNFTDALKKVCGKFNPLIKNTSIDLRISIPEQCFIFADPVLIERVLENLISNALKFTSPFGYIGISGTSANDMIRIEVNDNGTGINSKLLNKAFEEYMQDNSRSYIYSNPSGIGLTYCRLAVEAHGGKIGIISKPGEGTRVWFLVKKGDGQFLSYPDHSQNRTESIKILNELEKGLINSCLDNLKKTNIHEISTILRILNNNNFPENEKLRKWKEAVEAAVFTANNDQYTKLINL